MRGSNPQPSSIFDNRDGAVAEHPLYMDAAQEKICGAIHAVGIPLSCLAAWYLWNATAGSSVYLRWTCVIFSATAMTVYLFSALSHIVFEPQWRGRLRAWDQGCIYFLIAGTYSPFIWAASPTGYRSWIMFAVWIAAVLGLASKVILSHRVNAISAISYVLLGWLPAIPLIPRTPPASFAWMLLGGLLYTIGLYFLHQTFLRRHSHAIWHIFVMSGTASHFFAIALLVDQVS